MERNKKILILTILAIVFGLALGTLLEPTWQIIFTIAWIAICVGVEAKLL